ncbi:hypothetical protein EDB83DRAFT_2315369 [Lactarius deliciosus]|nr:hypothetical protein EDB83DRAFT_2315369 [Lactarius deliciosus]
MLGSWSGDALAVCTHPGRGVWRRKACLEACSDLVEREHGPFPPPCARARHPRPAGCGTQSGCAIKHQQNECRAATAAPSSFRSWALEDAGIDAADGLAARAVQAGRLAVTERAGASQSPPADHPGDQGGRGEEGLSRLTLLWTCPLLGSALRRVNFPPDAHLELEQGE